MFWRPRPFLFGIVGALLLVLGLQQPGLAQSGGQVVPQVVPQVVVELFTSQGCNSCPPADRLLGELAHRDDVIALTFNVDYWDYLGWKDTLAQPANTQRQRHYAAAMRNRSVYTPQMVIGGRQHAVGSDVAAVSAAIEAEQRRTKDTPKLTLAHRNDRIQISLAATDREGINATIWLVRFDQRRDVPIERGENAGNKLSYHNVVRDVRPLGHWRGQALQMDLSRAELAEGGRDGCAIIVQKGPVGPILAAARIEL
ncbi:MAG: DUF1223 domain-containing protein [Rhodospirillaceae bacterium]|nr:DUF1223 domain-containing protein [Rhodospirillaceae bacterium]MBT5193089.1 DUF1223 domain-containing protein [Rhodospirillaceae bacterium]MBT6427393.1 DUF1223 domain-containing protein [Rhodospirillaceae bacterium]MBT7758723.1 DUF1223 domain-containing protein [Rhodospirillaceae bacterium]